MNCLGVLSARHFLKLFYYFLSRLYYVWGKESRTNISILINQMREKKTWDQTVAWRPHWSGTQLDLIILKPICSISPEAATLAEFGVTGGSTKTPLMSRPPPTAWASFWNILCPPPKRKRKKERKEEEINISKSRQKRIMNPHVPNLPASTIINSWPISFDIPVLPNTIFFSDRNVPHLPCPVWQLLATWD